MVIELAELKAEIYAAMQRGFEDMYNDATANDNADYSGPRAVAFNAPYCARAGVAVQYADDLRALEGILGRMG